MAQMILLLEKFGKLGESHTKKLQDELFELRIKAQEAIARAIYAHQKDRVILILVVFVKKSQKTPKTFLDKAKQRLEEFKNGND